MSLHSYLTSHKLHDHDYPFSSLIMAAMRRADTGNQTLLRQAFPVIWNELKERYDAPGGLLAGECQPGIGCMSEDGVLYAACGCAHEQAVNGIHLSDCEYGDRLTATAK